jgi:NADPH:quinone reductase-like Zn-dependent oxidoreductase
VTGRGMIGGEGMPAGSIMMKAALCPRYGPPEVLRIGEVARPSPGRREVLVKIHASTVNSSDCFTRSGLTGGPVAMRMMMRLVVGFTGPRQPILGLVFAGEVTETGGAVERFRPGARVYAFTKFHLGGYAQYACLPEGAIVGHAPSNLSYAEAAAIPYGGLLALHLLRRAGIREGLRTLIYGASGAVGTSAVQIAKHFGAEVTAVCGPAHLDLVRSLGAGLVIDYGTQHTLPVDARYDLVFDAVGRRKTSPLKAACRAAIEPGGTYLSVDDGTPKLSARDLDQLTNLAEAGELRPVIDRSFPLEQIAQAHRYVEGEHKSGSVVITIGHEAE